MRVFLGWNRLPFSNYIDLLLRLGAEVEREHPEGCDALLLPGGGDLDPGLYRQEPVNVQDAEPERDAYELSLFRFFLLKQRPILGICRGAQLINVALGGTLHQHIDGHSRLEGRDRRHMVHTDDVSLLRLYGSSFSVNSAHHQAVDEPGSGLQITARAADGVIEGLRHTVRPVFAVQWHPERMGEAGAEYVRAFLKIL